MTITYDNGTVVEMSDGLLVIAMLLFAPVVIVLSCNLAVLIEACVKHCIRHKDPD
jgi:hypothetical protein